MKRRDPLAAQDWPPRFRWNPERRLWEVRSRSGAYGPAWRTSFALAGHGRATGRGCLRSLVEREGWQLRVVSYHATWAEETCHV